MSQALVKHARCGCIAVRSCQVETKETRRRLETAYIRQVADALWEGHTLLKTDWTECAPIHLNGRNDVLFAEKCIRLVCEKLTIFPYGQDTVLLAFW